MDDLAKVDAVEAPKKGRRDQVKKPVPFYSVGGVKWNRPTTSSRESQ